MNRHERRKAGYIHRLMAAHAKGHTPLGGLSIATIQHDNWCGIYKGRECSCTPDITLSDHEGVTVVDLDGNGTKVRRS
jgi:hypothetical protein